MTLLQCDDEQVVKFGTCVCAHVDDVRIDDFDQRPDHFSRGNAEELILLGRFPHNRCRINRIAPLSDLAEVDYWKLIGIRIVTEVVSNRPLDAAFAGPDGAFKY